MSNIVTGYSVKYTCSNCGQNVKEISFGDFGLSFFRVGDPNVTCGHCGIIHQIDAIREYKDLNIYEKTLFVLGFWIYVDIQAFYIMFKKDFDSNNYLMSKIFFLVWGIPFFIALITIKFFYMLALNPYIWLPIGIILNYSNRLRSLKRTNAQNL